MFEETVLRRLRPLAEAFAQSDLVRLTVREGDFDVELRRATPATAAVPARKATLGGGDEESGEPLSTRDYDVVRADLVGIVHLSRPPVSEGAVLESDRELAYVEALGIRNPIRSHGPGRVAIVYVDDGQAVEYGQPLFAIDRG